MKTKPMTAKSRSAKGSAFERGICTQLSLWWSGGDSDDLFYRTPGSGARATSRAKKAKVTQNQHGDVLATGEEGKTLLSLFQFELKRGYSGFTLQDMLDGKRSSPYDEWIDHVKGCSKAANSHSWMLIHRRDKRHAVCLLPTEVFDALMMDVKDTPHHWIRYGKESLTCVLFDDLLGRVKPRAVETLLAQLSRKCKTG
jgi:hypothetical protein